MESPPTIVGQFTAVRSGKLTARQTAEAGLAAMERVGSLNIFSARQTEEALEQADLVDAELAAGQDPGPLAGVCLGIKDNIDQAGIPSAAACQAYRDRIPDQDAEVIERLVQAGAIILGRTNMHELADGVTSEASCYGPVVNPWAAGHHPGGSSGGSAAAVAAGCLPAALGTDTGGSVRIPASLCGVVGLKPTSGLVPIRGVMPLSTSLDHLGPICRTVRGAAILLEVLAGLEGASLQAACERNAKGLKLGVLSGFGLEPDPAVADLFARARSSLTALGCDLQVTELDGLAEGTRLLSRIYPPEAYGWHAPALAERAQEFGPDVRADLERGQVADPSKRKAALARAEELSAEMSALMRGIDLLICPTTPHPAKAFGSANAHTYLTYTCPFNLTGQPAISVPMGLVDGLPVGLQVIGRRDDDQTVLRLAAAFEQVSGFECKPPTRAWE